MRSLSLFSDNAVACLGRAMTGPIHFDSFLESLLWLL